MDRAFPNHKFWGLFHEPSHARISIFITSQPQFWIMSFNYESKKEELRRKLCSIKPPSYNFDQDYNTRLSKAENVYEAEIPLWIEYCKFSQHNTKAILTRVGTSGNNNKIYTHDPTSIGESSTQKTSDVRPQPRIKKEPRMWKEAKTTPAGPPAHESDNSLSPLGHSTSPPAEEPTPSPGDPISSSPSVPEESSEEAEVENEMDDDGYSTDDRPTPPPPTDSDDDYKLKNRSKKKITSRARRNPIPSHPENVDKKDKYIIGPLTCNHDTTNIIQGKRTRKPAH